MSARRTETAIRDEQESGGTRVRSNPPRPSDANLVRPSGTPEANDTDGITG